MIIYCSLKIMRKNGGNIMLRELKKEVEESKFYSKRAYEKMMYLSALIMALYMEKKEETKISKVILLLVLVLMVLDDLNDMIYLVKKLKDKSKKKQKIVSYRMNGEKNEKL